MKYLDFVFMRVLRVTVCDYYNVTTKTFVSVLPTVKDPFD